MQPQTLNTLLATTTSAASKPTPGFPTEPQALVPQLGGLFSTHGYWRAIIETSITHVSNPLLLVM